MSQEKDVNSEDATSATVANSLASLKQGSVMGPAKDPSKTRVEKRMPSQGEDTLGRDKKNLKKSASSANRTEMRMRSPSPPPPPATGDVDMSIETTETGERGRDRPERAKFPARHNKYDV